MKIIVVGSGKIGFAAARMLSEDGHDVTVIERDADQINNLSNMLDVICVEGSATDPEVLTEAGVQNADFLIAATAQDEVNMLCAVTAGKLGVKNTVARVRDPQYGRSTAFIRDTLGINRIINPDMECAKAISRTLRFPGAVRVDNFSKGSLEIAEHVVGNGGPLDGVKLKDLGAKFNARVLVDVVERDGEAYIPNGLFELKNGDRLNIAGESRELRKFFAALGRQKKTIKNVMIAGGGRTAVYLARILNENGMNVTVIERDRERCEKLCELIPKARIVCADATHGEELLEEGLMRMDAFVALTGDDEDNIIMSMYSHNRGLGKTITKVNRDQYSTMLESLGLESVVMPKEITAQQITSYARATENSKGISSVETMHLVAGGKVEVLEFKVSSKAKCVGIPLKDLKLKPNILISAIIRNEKSLIPNGLSVIEPGDHAVIISAAGRIKTIDEIIGSVG